MATVIAQLFWILRAVYAHEVDHSNSLGTLPTDVRMDSELSIGF